MDKIRKPDWLVNFLLGLQWDILTWHIDVGGPIEDAIDWVLEPINAIWEWISQLVAWFEEFRQEIVDFFALVPTWINEVWQFITNLWDTLAGWVDNWWAGVTETVKGWIDVARQFVLDLLTELSQELSQLTTQVQGFFSSILPTLASITIVQDIVKMALAPFVSLFNWFESVKDDLTEFFSDPWAWLYRKFDEFFERFW